MFANLSGYLTSLLYGFTGLQLGPGRPESWAARPAALPDGGVPSRSNGCGSAGTRMPWKPVPGLREAPAIAAPLGPGPPADRAAPPLSWSRSWARSLVACSP